MFHVVLLHCVIPHYTRTVSAIHII